MRVASLLLLLLAAPGVLAQSVHPLLLDASIVTDLPLVEANDNREAAGVINEGTLEIDLEVVEADWRIETPTGPGLRVAALAEAGQPPSVPGPLIRVDGGTRIRARVRNTLADSTITVFGLQARPVQTPDSLVVEPGAVGVVEFDAGAPGTYLYWVRLGAGAQEGAEREQLAGAFVVDPPGGSLPDRVFVINVFSERIDTTLHDLGWLEALTINGLSWPFTERLRPAVGDTLRWRVVNASERDHPMHLHGFYFNVTSRGTPFEDTIYETEDRRAVVTETLEDRETMAMEWVPSRPGKWLFHCHLSFHVAPEIRLPGAAEADHEHHHSHMLGLVLGIEVQPGPTDLISHGERRLTLYAKEYPEDSLSHFGFALDPAFQPDATTTSAPGPPLILQQYETTYVTVENRLPVPTSVHWHGLEIDAWSDGVPGYSASEGRVSPAIAPGEAFTYKLSLMRAGTFIYHSHFDDIQQLTAGLYGPLIVLAEGETYDPEKDHFYIVGWNRPDPQSPADLELNGRSEQPVQHATVGETHRLRIMNIAPAGMIAARMLRDSTVVPLRALAKDGADLPPHQQVEVASSPRLGVGETADFAFTATEPGVYDLEVGYRQFQWRQRWVVAKAVGSR